MHNVMPNATYIPPARIGARVGHYRVVLAGKGLRWVSKAFRIPTRWYLYRESLAFGVFTKASPKRKPFCVLVEYRLYPIDL